MNLGPFIALILTKYSSQVLESQNSSSNGREVAMSIPSDIVETPKSAKWKLPTQGKSAVFAGAGNSHSDRRHAPVYFRVHFASDTERQSPDKRTGNIQFRFGKGVDCGVKCQRQRVNKGVRNHIRLPRSTDVNTKVPDTFIPFFILPRSTDVNTKVPDTFILP